MANKTQNKQKKIIKIRTQISEIQTRKSIEKINETESWFFEMINKIHKPLTRLRR